MRSSIASRCGFWSVRRQKSNTRIGALSNAFDSANARSSSSSCCSNVKSAPYCGVFGLEGDFGAPGQSILKIGDAISETLSVRVPVDHVLVVHRADLDPSESELARRDLARVRKVLRDLVRDDRELEPGRGGQPPDRWQCRQTEAEQKVTT